MHTEEFAFVNRAGIHPFMDPYFIRVFYNCRGDPFEFKNLPEKVFLKYFEPQTVICRRYLAGFRASFSNHWTSALCQFYPVLEVTGTIWLVTLIPGLQGRWNDLIWSFLSWGIWECPIHFMKFLKEKIDEHSARLGRSKWPGSGRWQCRGFTDLRVGGGQPLQERGLGGGQWRLEAGGLQAPGAPGRPPPPQAESPRRAVARRQPLPAGRPLGGRPFMQTWTSSAKIRPWSSGPAPACSS